MRIRPNVPADNGGSFYRPDHKPRHKGIVPNPYARRDAWAGNPDTDKHWVKD